jgi:ABC-type glutathione transport system ATPase component
MAADDQRQVATHDPLVHVRGLSKEYAQRRWLSREKFVVRALDNVDLSIETGRMLALVGESGSGKSTLARCLARLEEPTAGEISFDGKNLLALSREELLPLRRQIQLVMQEPAGALNARFSAIEVIAEPLVIHRLGCKATRRQRALELMHQVGLPPEWGNKSPREFSGGQRQRLAIARALALGPRFLILDEVLSGLDLSIQAQIVNLLIEMQASQGLTYVLISHDLSLVASVADEIAVIHRGKIVERGAPAEVLTNSRHEQTRALVASMFR